MAGILVRNTRILRCKSVGIDTTTSSTHLAATEQVPLAGITAACKVGHGDTDGCLFHPLSSCYCRSLSHLVLPRGTTCVESSFFGDVSSCPSRGAPPRVPAQKFEAGTWCNERLRQRDDLSPGKNYVTNTRTAPQNLGNSRQLSPPPPQGLDILLVERVVKAVSEKGAGDKPLRSVKSWGKQLV